MNRAYELAKAEIGTVEWAKGSNPKVIAYYADAGHSEVKDDAVAWCAAFVGAMLKRAGMKNTGSLAARSYLDWGIAVPLSEAKEGDIVIFKRGNSSWQGHVGFYVSHNDSGIKVLGGNQKDSVNVQNISSQLLGVRRAQVAIAPKKVEPAPAPKLGVIDTLLGMLRALFGGK